MGTRAVICFWEDDELFAQVFRSGDGYPSYLGRELEEFLHSQLEERPYDTRFDDMGILAARWVLHDMTHYAAKNLCECAIVMQEYDDVEYRYHISWSEGLRQIRVVCENVETKQETLLKVIQLEEVPCRGN